MRWRSIWYLGCCTSYRRKVRRLDKVLSPQYSSGGSYKCDLCGDILWLLLDWIDMLTSCSMQTKLFMSIVAFLCTSKRFNELLICCVAVYNFLGGVLQRYQSGCFQLMNWFLKVIDWIKWLTGKLGSTKTDAIFGKSLKLLFNPNMLNKKPMQNVNINCRPLSWKFSIYFPNILVDPDFPY